MIFSALWWIAAAVLNLIRSLGNTKFYAIHMWGLKIHKVINCFWVTQPDVSVRVNLCHQFVLGGVYGFVHTEAWKEGDDRVKQDIRHMHKSTLVIKAWVPFNCTSSTLQVWIGHPGSNDDKMHLIQELRDLEWGIHEFHIRINQDTKELTYVEQIPRTRQKD